MIKPVNELTLPTWASFASQVWHADEDFLLEKFANNEFPFEFLYHTQADEVVAWISLSLRYDYVEGCKERPIAYLEGIFVNPDDRHQEIATQLLHFAESWAQNRGIGQLASDTELTNLVSQNFHTKHGFREVGRIVHYVRDLSSD